MFEKVLNTPLEYTIILKVSNKDRKLMTTFSVRIFVAVRFGYVFFCQGGYFEEFSSIIFLPSKTSVKLS